MATLSAPEFDAAGAPRAAVGGPARHHRRQPARARRATRSPRTAGSAPTDARSFRMRSRAAPTPCCGSAFGFRWNPAWKVANVAVDDLKSKLGAIADSRLRQLRRDRCGWSASPEPTARPRARTGSRNASTRCGRRAGDHRHARQRARRRAAPVAEHDAGRRARPRDARRDARRGRARRSRWRSRRTRSTRGASTRSSSTSRSSPTSPATTSTTTARWRRTERRRRGSSPGPDSTRA